MTIRVIIITYSQHLSTPGEGFSPSVLTTILEVALFLPTDTSRQYSEVKNLPRPQLDNSRAGFPTAEVKPLPYKVIEATPIGGTACLRNEAPWSSDMQLEWIHPHTQLVPCSVFLQGKRNPFRKLLCLNSVTPPTPATAR